MKKQSILLIAFLMVGCVAPPPKDLFISTPQLLKQRQLETRRYDEIVDMELIAACANVLQDLGFVIERADLVLGSVSGTKLDKLNRSRITVSVREKGSNRMLVRANAQFNVTPIKDPKQYQNFFASLEKALFLTAHAGE
jgi:hypothetical protein